MVNEKRNLIDQDLLIDSLGASDMEIFAKEVISEAPTVDAVEVCRCKDCSYAKDMHPLANAPAYKMGVCTVRKEDGIEFTVWGQDFCSYGERREGE